MISFIAFVSFISDISGIAYFSKAPGGPIGPTELAANFLAATQEAVAAPAIVDAEMHTSLAIVHE